MKERLSHYRMSFGWDVKWCPVLRPPPPSLRQAKKFLWKVSAWGPPEKDQNIKYSKPYTINLIEDGLQLVKLTHSEKRKWRWACVQDPSGINDESGALYNRDNFLDSLKLFPFIIDDVYLLLVIVHHVCRGSAYVL